MGTSQLREKPLIEKHRFSRICDGLCRVDIPAKKSNLLRNLKRRQAKVHTGPQGHRINDDALCSLRNSLHFLGRFAMFLWILHNILERMDTTVCSSVPKATTSRLLTAYTFVFSGIPNSKFQSDHVQVIVVSIPLGCSRLLDTFRNISKHVLNYTAPQFTIFYSS
jgi:hypothetical protein